MSSVKMRDNVPDATLIDSFQNASASKCIPEEFKEKFATERLKSNIILRKILFMLNLQ